MNTSDTDAPRETDKITLRFFDQSRLGAIDAYASTHRLDRRSRAADELLSLGVETWLASRGGPQPACARDVAAIPNSGAATDTVAAARRVELDKITLRLDRARVGAIDAYATGHGINRRSQAADALLTLGIETWLASRGTSQPASAPDVAEIAPERTAPGSAAPAKPIAGNSQQAQPACERDVAQVATERAAPAVDLTSAKVGPPLGAILGAVALAVSLAVLALALRAPIPAPAATPFAAEPDLSAYATRDELAALDTRDALGALTARVDDLARTASTKATSAGSPATDRVATPVVPTTEKVEVARFDGLTIYRMGK